MTFKLSERDVKLLFILAIVILIAGSVKLFDTLSTEVMELQQEYRSLSDKYSDLMVKNARKETYISETDMANASYKEKLAMYNTSLSQEQTLVFLGLVEKNTGVWLKQVGFSQNSDVYTFGQVTSSNPSNSGKKVYSSDYKGISTTMTLAYECSYAELKDVLVYLEENGKKATVSNISFTYSQSTDTVSGTMQLTLYAITGSDREVPKVGIKDVAVGTDNIFSSDTFMPSMGDGSYRDQIINNYDLYMIMNRVGSDMDNLSVGTAGDPLNETVVASDSAGVENVTIRITGSAGEYKVSYKVGSAVYPADNYNDGATLVCGDALDLLIISKPRAGADDASMANVTLINESDMVLNVAIIDDDVEKPRVNIESTQGSVIFYTE